MGEWVGCVVACSGDADEAVLGVQGVVGQVGDDEVGDGGDDGKGCDVEASLFEVVAALGDDVHEHKGAGVWWDGHEVGALGGFVAKFRD